jgi:hypothetical protein
MYQLTKKRIVTMLLFNWVHTGGPGKKNLPVLRVETGSLAKKSTVKFASGNP